MTIEIDLEVLWLTDEQLAKEDLEIDYEIDYDKSPTRTHTFYSIAFVRELDKKGYCQIGSNGDEFIVKESYQSVKQKIKDQIVFKWN